MSLNLTLHEGKNGPEIPLWQTPSHITFMCLSINSKETQEYDGGQEGVRRRYLHWVNSFTSGSWEKREDLEHMIEDVEEHIELVKSVKDPHFSYT